MVHILKQYVPTYVALELTFSIEVYPLTCRCTHPIMYQILFEDETLDMVQQQLVNQVCTLRKKSIFVLWTLNEVQNKPSTLKGPKAINC